MEIVFAEILDTLLDIEKRIPIKDEKDWASSCYKLKVKKLAELNLISLKETDILLMIDNLTEQGINLLEKVRNNDVRQNIINISENLEIKKFETFLKVIDTVFVEYIKKNIN